MTDQIHHHANLFAQHYSWMFGIPFEQKLADALAACDITFVFSTECRDVDLPERWPGGPVLAKPYKLGDLTAAVSALLASR
jgi:hypothetical protein